MLHYGKFSAFFGRLKSVMHSKRILTLIDIKEHSRVKILAVMSLKIRLGVI